MQRDDDTSLDRRQAPKCAAWAGSGLVWTLNGGVPTSSLVGSAEAAGTGFSFVQISDSHIGFNKPANPDPNATLADAIAKIGVLAGANATNIARTRGLGEASQREDDLAAARLAISASRLERSFRRNKARPAVWPSALAFGAEINNFVPMSKH
jgi:hypothetical protein